MPAESASEFFLLFGEWPLGFPYAELLCKLRNRHDNIAEPLSLILRAFAEYRKPKRKRPEPEPPEWLR